MRLATATKAARFTEDARTEDLVAVRDLAGRVLATASPLVDEEVAALAWSGDAKRLAFTSFGRIYVVRADGTDRRWVLRRYRAEDLAWSREGRLAWTPPRGGRLRVTNRARSRVVRKLRVTATRVAWSPGGRRLAYLAPGKVVRTIGVDGRSRHTVTRRCTGQSESDIIDTDIAWSPDGRQLLCTTSKEQLISVNLQTRRTRVLVRAPASVPITSFDWQRVPRR
jgi:Tol biopolymer transport system component